MTTSCVSHGRGTVGFGGEVFSNQRKDQLATKIPLEGSFANPETDIWYTIVDLLRNAFIQGTAAADRL